jgi:hypothetical protein
MVGIAPSLVESALGGEQRLRVDDDGGLHAESGRRVGAIRRTPSGEWITDRQNAAFHANTVAALSTRETPASM